ncbi:hypothetical protein GUJ93_ZPchr0004g39557 [Zizania palustris]|uniref:Uncharacterized protein n=1 Tax=Zizania palustris TaxID=103762 RepID=A0A8J5VFB2_ZIZPA|nr:hypothetical protein GUJ93_ZPchr0004g39557 [Zizania palustris]
MGSCHDKLPRVNWMDHANAIQSSCIKADFLSSSFLFSLPAQKPDPESNRTGMLSLRYNLLIIQQIILLFKLRSYSSKIQLLNTSVTNPYLCFFRSAACKIQSLERLQVSLIEKAWCSLCNTRVAHKSYLRPGLSTKVKECAKDHAHTYGTSSYKINIMGNVPRNSIPSQQSMHQPTESGTPENSTRYPPAGTKSCTGLI